MHSIAVYLVQLAYGGPEEGGWFYQTGELCTDPELTAFGTTFAERQEARAKAMSDEVQAHLDRDWNTGDHAREISSVLSAGRFEARVYDGWPPIAPRSRSRRRMASGPVVPRSMRHTRPTGGRASRRSTSPTSPRSPRERTSILGVLSPIERMPPSLPSLACSRMWRPSRALPRPGVTIWSTNSASWSMPSAPMVDYGSPQQRWCACARPERPFSTTSRAAG